jgi:Fic family protein
MAHGLRRLNDLPISNRLIREIHAELMRDVRGGYAAPGEFRTSQNWIGPPGCTLNDATFVPPPPDEMLHALAELERYINADPTEPPLVQAALIHYQFEAIHPFLDGNGRVGRLLIALFLCHRGHLNEPVLSLSSYFERHRNDYYRLLLDISQRGAWTEWLHFFLEGVVKQAGEALRMAKDLIALHRRYMDTIATDRGPQIAARIVDHLFLNPVLSVSTLAKEWDVTFPTIQKGVNYLVDKNVIVEITGQQRQRIYAANEILRTHRIP